MHVCVYVQHVMCPGKPTLAMVTVTTSETKATIAQREWCFFPLRGSASMHLSLTPWMNGLLTDAIGMAATAVERPVQKVKVNILIGYSPLLYIR